jgi:predicted Zn-dependent peptidase
MNDLRAKQPEIYSLDSFDLINPERKYFRNGIPVYMLNAGTQDIVKIDIIYFAGSFYQKQLLVARMTNNMLTEGTKNYDSYSISEIMDFYGASVHTSCFKDNAVVTLVSLSKHFKSILPVFEEIIKYPVFPDNDLRTLLNKEKADFLDSMKKVKDVASYNFNGMLFGNDHPYGKLTVFEDFDKVTSSPLRDFYNQYYNSRNCKIVISGKISDEVMVLMENYFGQDNWNDNISDSNAESKFSINTIKTQKNVIVRDDAVQSAIRIGKPTINILHPDFNKLVILNTLFGGYFGSRLMNNIREDKGYTYGIYSSMISFKRSGMFYISTEVGVDVCEKAIDEIYIELKKLRTEKVSIEELKLVKNYLLGNLLRSLDGPFAIADKFREIIDYDIVYTEFINKYIETINKTNANELIELAEIYFNESDMIELVVGKK